MKEAVGKEFGRLRRKGRQSPERKESGHVSGKRLIESEIENMNE